jgi:hypothetical protein
MALIKEFEKTPSFSKIIFHNYQIISTFFVFNYGLQYEWIYGVYKYTLHR